MLESLREKAINVIVPATACLLDLPHRIGDAIEHDRHQYDRESALECLTNVEPHAYPGARYRPVQAPR